MCVLRRGTLILEGFIRFLASDDFHPLKKVKQTNGHTQFGVIKS